MKDLLPPRDPIEAMGEAYELLLEKMAQIALHFHNPGHIPPCPKCNNTHFHRQHIG